MKHRIITILFLTFWVILQTAAINAEPNQTSQLLRFQAQDQDLNYLTTYYRETTNLINVSDDTGMSENLRNESYDYGELMKKQTQTQAGTHIQIFDKVSYLKKETKASVLNADKPMEVALQIEPRGRLDIPFSMNQALFIGIPVVFPQEAVGVNQEWTGSLDFHDDELPPLNLNQKFTLKKIQKVGGHTVAVIDYTLQTELHATDMSEDSIVQQKISELKSHNIESVSYDGQGTLAFDFENGRIQTHLLTLTTRISKSYIVDNKRTLKETTTIYEFAEALLP